MNVPLGEDGQRKWPKAEVQWTGGVVTIYVDGAAKGTPGPAGVGIVFVNEAGAEFHHLACDIGLATNNQAEYKALLRALWEAMVWGIQDVSIKSDSEVVVHQMNGKYQCRHPDLIPLWQLGREMRQRFRAFTIEHIPRAKNARADQLANEGVYRCPRE